MRFLEEVKPPFLSIPYRFSLMEITYSGGRARRSRCSASHARHAQELTPLVLEFYTVNIWSPHIERCRFGIHGDYGT